jgi:aminoglycoside phosphotransferase (APT) family kinase protein
MSAPWVAEIEVPEQLARRLLDEQFPEFRDCPLTLLGEGWDNVAWQVGDGWVFRFPRRQVAADLITAENAVMPGVAEHLTAPVAWPQRVGQPTDDYQWPFAGYSLIKGEELCMAAPPAGRRLLLAEELGKFLRSLHAVSAEEASKLGAPLDTIRRLDIKYRSRRTIEYLARAVDLGLIENLRPWELLLEHVIPLCRQPRSVCLVHGDLYSRHVIVKSADNGGDQDARLADVIDWGDLHVGEPAIDLSCAWSLFDTAGRQLLLDCYGDVDSGTLALARFRAVAHSAVCLVYGRDSGAQQLEQASKDALFWLLED